MIRPHRRSACCFVIVLALAGAGCGSSCGSNKDKGKSSAPRLQPTAQPTNTPTKSKERVAFNALVDSVLRCKWAEPRGFTPRCRQLKQFFRSDLTMNEKWLSELLTDANPRKRWIGANGLRRGRSYRNDKQLATSVVAAMEKETNAAVAVGLADAISRIRLEQTGLLDRVKKLIGNHPVSAARQRLLKHTLFYNQALLYDFVAAIARKETDAAVRRSAIAALFTGTPKGRYADTCKLWSELLGDPEPKIGALGGAYLTRYSRGLCKGYYEAVLGIIAKRAKAGAVKAEQLTDSLRNVYLQAAASPAQKKRAVAVALSLLKNVKNYGPSRARALELLSRAHPNGKQLVKAHLKDKDGFVMRRAERLSKMSVNARRRKRGVR